MLLPAGAVLFRCAQPLVGVMGRVCGADERIVRAAVDAMGDGRGVVAIDCRLNSARSVTPEPSASITPTT